MARKTDRGLPGNREAYVDTSALIAFLDKSDSHHSMFRNLFASTAPLVTSALVIAEGHGWFLRRYDRQRAAQFLTFVDSLSPLTVLKFDTVELSKRRKVLARFGDHNLTLADSHGLAIMQERRTSVCYSTDRHLNLGGVRLVTMPERIH